WRQLADELAGGVRPLSGEGAAAQGVEVVGDVGAQAARRHRGAADQRGGRDLGGQLPPASRGGPGGGEGEVEEADQAVGVLLRGGERVELDAEVGGRDTDAGEADLPVGGDRDRGGPEDEVVDAASAGRLEGAGHLADDGAGLLGRQGGAGGELAEGG